MAQQLQLVQSAAKQITSALFNHLPPKNLELEMPGIGLQIIELYHSPEFSVLRINPSVYAQWPQRHTLGLLKIPKLPPPPHTSTQPHVPSFHYLQGMQERKLGEGKFSEKKQFGFQCLLGKLPCS